MDPISNNPADKKEYGVDYNYCVSFENGSVTIGFAKISNMQSKIEYDVIHEGGNPVPVLLPKPAQNPETITFEKGMLLSNSAQFWDRLRPGMMVTGVEITVKHNGKVVRSLAFEQGIVLEKAYPVLDATSSKIFIEQLQIAHSGLKEEFKPYD
ncbi:phage tail protein [[Clostridium] polysaccharolyticum]|uniref:Virus tail tube protein gp19 n=1 Tax=[Clostridium] polysaccharolyticum TaxID=29364 RepID=A0A1I0C9K2_9FIRM|nr:phage tail protein [[Clostridium] polysaccharolyticum]SET16106.1 virus tail tube protein gp19 [[Clostridium] polysaccharolyticum]